jgi:HAE1 family hydrophobic/amphiphilic exporter-1
VLCSRFLRPHATEAERRHGRIYRATERGFEAMQSFYARTLRIALRHRSRVVLIALGTVILTIVFATILPRGFIPTDDDGLINAQTEAPQDVSFEELTRNQLAAAAIVAKHPAVEAFMASASGTGGRMTIRLKDRSERPPAPRVVQELRRQLAVVPGLRAYPQQPAPIRIGGAQTRSLYQFTLTSSDLDALYAAAQDFEPRLRAIRRGRCRQRPHDHHPQASVEIDRDRAATLGLTPQQIEDTLYSAYGSRQVSTIYTQTNQYYVIMEVAREFQREPESLAQLHLRARNGQLVPLDAVATVRRKVGPLSVNHYGQVPSVTLSFNLAPGTSLSQAQAAIDKLAAEHLPAGVGHDYQGTAQAFAASSQGLVLLLILAVVVIYIVLGILYEDFIHPLTILSGLPAAGFGALFTLWLFGEELNIMGYVGVILLIGIVKKNAIMMIDFALALRAGGETSDEKAITDACLVRFRPIMMTTFAALASTLPIALGLGAGAESRRPLGLAVVGGLVVSQL